MRQRKRRGEASTVTARARVYTMEDLIDNRRSSGIQ
jgi:hypothetical protein